MLGFSRRFGKKVLALGFNLALQVAAIKTGALQWLGADVPAQVILVRVESGAGTNEEDRPHRKDHRNRHEQLRKSAHQRPARGADHEHCLECRAAATTGPRRPSRECRWGRHAG